MENIYNSLSNGSERDWRDKQKVIDSLRDTVDKQRKDMDGFRKEALEKDILCSALRVSARTLLLKPKLSVPLRTVVLSHCSFRTYLTYKKSCNLTLCVQDSIDRLI